MNILILNGNPDLGNTVFDNYIHRYQLTLHKMGHYVKTYVLRNLQVDYSVSIQTVATKNDLIYINNSLADAELIVIASPLADSRVSELITGIQKKMIDFFTKKMEKDKGSNTRFTVINRIPLFGCIIMPEVGSDSHDLLLNKLTQERMAASIHSMLRFFITTDYAQNEAVLTTIKCMNENKPIESDKFALAE